MMQQRQRTQQQAQGWQASQQAWQAKIQQALMQRGIAPDLAQQASQDTQMLHSLDPTFFRWFSSSALGPAASS
jgi:hypothetical protein